MNKQFFILPFFIFSFSLCAISQRAQLSLATDLGLQRSFKKGQQYWAGGQTIHAHFHLTPKDGIYVWIAYYSDGTFKNTLTATAKSPLTAPQQIIYVNQADMRFKHFSTGWKKYLKGAFNTEEGWSLYGYTGFGLLLGRVENMHSNVIDTNVYVVPVKSGKANFKRLTLDLGLGWESPIGGSIYFYVEGRTWLPTTSYPSKYILVNKNAPLAGMFNLGVRILFD